MLQGQSQAFERLHPQNLPADQSIEELNRFGAELFEALAKQLLFAALVGAGPMLIVGALVAGLRCQQFFMGLNTFLGSIALVVGFDAFSARYSNTC